MLPVRIYEPEKFSCFFLIGGKHSLKFQIQRPLNNAIIFSVPENPSVVSSSYLEKYGILSFLPEDRSRMLVYLFFVVVFFSIGDRIEIMVLEDRERVQSNGN